MLNQSWKRLYEQNALTNQTRCESHMYCIPEYLLYKEGRISSACWTDIQVSVSADRFNSHTLKRGSCAEMWHWKLPKALNVKFLKRMGFCAQPGKHHVFVITLSSAVPSVEITLWHLSPSSIWSSGLPCSSCKELTGTGVWEFASDNHHWHLKTSLSESSCLTLLTYYLAWASTQTQDCSTKLPFPQVPKMSYW